MKKKSIKIRIVIYVILVILLSWIAFTTVIAEFKNPKLKETELFLRIHKSFILDFK